MAMRLFAAAITITAALPLAAAVAVMCGRGKVRYISRPFPNSTASASRYLPFMADVPRPTGQRAGHTARAMAALRADLEQQDRAWKP